MRHAACFENSPCSLHLRRYFDRALSSQSLRSNARSSPSQARPRETHRQTTLLRSVALCLRDAQPLTTQRQLRTNARDLISAWISAFCCCHSTPSAVYLRCISSHLKPTIAVSCYVCCCRYCWRSVRTDFLRSPSPIASILAVTSLIPDDRSSRLIASETQLLRRRSRIPPDLCDFSTDSPFDSRRLRSCYKGLQHTPIDCWNRENNPLSIRNLIRELPPNRATTICAISFSSINRARKCVADLCGIHLLPR